MSPTSPCLRPRHGTARAAGGRRPARAARDAPARRAAGAPVRVRRAGPTWTSSLGDLLDVVGRAAGPRPEALRRLDRRREIDPDWFQSPAMIGYVAYADRFAKTLAGVRDRLDYLAELGVTYLHLMPLLKAREGDNDGGYAVQDYGAVEPRLGSMDDLEALAADLHERGMSLCIDLVLNHTAAEHRWARAAAAGRPGVPRLLPDLSGPHRAGRLRAHAAGSVPGQRSWQLHRRARGRGRLDDVQHLPVGPELGQPAGLRRDAGGPARPGQPRHRRRCGWTPRRSCGSGWAPTARTSRRPT